MILIIFILLYIYINEYIIKKILPLFDFCIFKRDINKAKNNRHLTLQPTRYLKIVAFKYGIIDLLFKSIHKILL